jgi:hypothetical protein
MLALGSASVEDARRKSTLASEVIMVELQWEVDRRIKKGGDAGERGKQGRMGLRDSKAWQVQRYISQPASGCSAGPMGAVTDSSVVHEIEDWRAVRVTAGAFILALLGRTETTKGAP